MLDEDAPLLANGEPDLSAYVRVFVPQVETNRLLLQYEWHVPSSSSPSSSSSSSTTSSESSQFLDDRLFTLRAVNPDVLLSSLEAFNSQRRQYYRIRNGTLFFLLFVPLLIISIVMATLGKKADASVTASTCIASALLCVLLSAFVLVRNYLGFLSLLADVAHDESHRSEYKHAGVAWQATRHNHLCAMIHPQKAIQLRVERTLVPCITKRSSWFKQNHMWTTEFRLALDSDIDREAHAALLSTLNTRMATFHTLSTRLNYLVTLCLLVLLILLLSNGTQMPVRDAFIAILSVVGVLALLVKYAAARTFQRHAHQAVSDTNKELRAFGTHAHDLPVSYHLQDALWFGFWIVPTHFQLYVSTSQPIGASVLA